MSRYVSIYDDLEKWDYFYEPLYLRIILFLIFHANYVAKEWVDGGVIVNRGELITSKDKIASHVHCTPDQVDTALKYMEYDGCIEVSSKKGRGFLLIKLKKFAYLSSKSESQSHSEPDVIPNFSRGFPEDNPKFVPNFSALHNNYKESQPGCANASPAENENEELFNQ